jgi:hypothetical protein
MRGTIGAINRMVHLMHCVAMLDFRFPLT